MFNTKSLLRCYSKFDIKVRAFIHIRTTIFPYYDLLETFIPEEGRILDLGCGFGIFTNLMAKKSSKRTVTGLDLLSNRLNIAIEAASIGRIRNVEYKRCDIKGRLPKDDGVFDAITLIDVLCYIPFSAQRELLINCYKMLKSNGVLLLKDAKTSPGWKYRLFYLEELVKVKSKILFKKGDDCWGEIFKDRFYVKDCEETKRFLEEIGFSVRIMHLDKWNYQPHIAYISIKK